MRNVFKVVGSVASVALLLSGAATAAPPQPFGTWSVDSAGVISGAGTGCAASVVGAGFLQCQITIGTKTYIQTIIAEGFAATGTGLDRLSFRSQDFVQIGKGSTQGVAASMGIKDTVTNPGVTFGTTADILTGWATGNTNKSETELTLSLDKPGAASANEDFLSDFNVRAITDSTNANKIAKLGLGQTVELGLNPNGTAVGKQRFELRQEPADPAVTAYTVDGITNNPLGGVLTAAAGSPLQGLWIGQTVTGTDAFAHQKLSSLTSGGALVGSTSLTTLGSTAKVDWGSAGQVFFDQFGAIPAF